MKPHEVDALAGVAPLLSVVSAWRVWKRTHDIGDEKHCCCARTKQLFHALDQLEKEILDDAGPLP